MRARHRDSSIKPPRKIVNPSLRSDTYEWGRDLSRPEESFERVVREAFYLLEQRRHDVRQRPSWRRRVPSEIPESYDPPAPVEAPPASPP